MADELINAIANDIARELGGAVDGGVAKCAKAIITRHLAEAPGECDCEVRVRVSRANNHDYYVQHGPACAARMAAGAEAVNLAISVDPVNKLLRRENELLNHDNLELQAETARLKAAIDPDGDFANDLPGLVAFVPDLLHAYSELGHMDEKDAEIKTLREALEAFAHFAEKFDANPLRGLADEFYAIHSGEDEAVLRLSDCRRARAALAGEKLMQKLTTALELLERAAKAFEEVAPDPQWWRDYFLLTGTHMILTEEGWESPEAKDAYIADDPDWRPLDEVNAPALDGKS